MIFPSQQMPPQPVQGNSFNTPSPAGPQAQPQAMPQPDEIAGGHRALEATMDGLIKLVGKPQGELTKKDVFEEASTMISHGAFPTPEGKQQLIAELAKLPDDETGIRKALGQQLLQLSMLRGHFHTAFGPPQPQGMPQEMPQGAPQ